MGPDCFECFLVLATLHALFHMLNHDDFWKNCLQISPRQLEDHSVSGAANNLGPSLYGPAIQQFPCHNVINLDLDFLVTKLVFIADPLVEFHIKHVQLIIHVGGGASENQELMVKIERRTVVYNLLISIQCKLFVLQTNCTDVFFCSFFFPS